MNRPVHFSICSRTALLDKILYHIHLINVIEHADPTSFNILILVKQLLSDIAHFGVVFDWENDRRRVETALKSICHLLTVDDAFEAEYRMPLPGWASLVRRSAFQLLADSFPSLTFDIMHSDCVYKLNETNATFRSHPDFKEQFKWMIPSLFDNKKFPLSHTWMHPELEGIVMPSSLADDILTDPGSKIVFNAPFEDLHTYLIKIANSTSRRIGWQLATNNNKRIRFRPSRGLLSPSESVTAIVTWQSYAYHHEDSRTDWITLSWVDTPEADSPFRREWFGAGPMIRTKRIHIEHNI